MARLTSIGFELNSLTAGVEIDSTSSPLPSIVTSPVRSGTYALKCDSTTGSDKWIQYKFSNSGVIIGYIRVYIYINTAPSSGDVFLAMNTANSSQVFNIVLNTDRTIQLQGTGTKSSILSLNTWYRLEIEVDFTTQSAVVLTGKLDGIQFESLNTDLTSFPTLNNFAEFILFSGGDYGGLYYFDDIAINTNTGSFQNSWPGSGSIVHLRPNAIGDNSQWTPDSGDNYTNVDEVTPDDYTSLVVTGGSSIDDYNIDNTPVAIVSGDIINLIHVGVRYYSGSETGSIRVRAKKETSGTVSEGSTIDTSGSTVFNTNANAAPKNYPLTLYQDPDSSDWTKTILDTSQIGIRTVVVPTDENAGVSTLWMLVDYTPAAITTSTTTTISTSTTTSTSSTTTSNSTTLTTSSSTSTTRSTSTSSTTTSSSTSTTKSTSTSSTQSITTSTSSTTTSSSTSTTKSTSTSSTTTSSSTSITKSTSTTQSVTTSTSSTTTSSSTSISQSTSSTTTSSSTSTTKSTSTTRSTSTTQSVTTSTSSTTTSVSTSTTTLAQFTVETVKTNLLAKLNAMGTLKAAFDYPTGNPNGKYPFAVLTLREGEGRFGSTAHNIRREGYTIRVYQEQSKLGQGVEAAESISINVLSELQSALDMDTTLSGTCKYVVPVSWNATYENRELDIRVLEVNVNAYGIVDSK